eukprot:1157025-Pelagomonas_calceolata.AAC.2
MPAGSAKRGTLNGTGFLHACRKCQKRHSEWYRALYDGDETNVPAYLQKAVNFWVNHTYQNRWLPKDGGERPVSYEFDASKKRWHAKEV